MPKLNRFTEGFSFFIIESIISHMSAVWRGHYYWIKILNITSLVFQFFWITLKKTASVEIIWSKTSWKANINRFNWLWILFKSLFVFIHHWNSKRRAFFMSVKRTILIYVSLAFGLLRSARYSVSTTTNTCTHIMMSTDS